MSNNNVVDINSNLCTLKEEELDPLLNPRDNCIIAFLHCELCIKELPHGISPSDWASTEIGFTEVGIQMWCKRHDCNIIHINFEGAEHPAMTTRNR